MIRADDQFCPACGEDEDLTRWAAEDLDDDQQSAGGKAAWACNRCGWEDSDGLPTIARLMAAEPGTDDGSGTARRVALWMADGECIRPEACRHLWGPEEYGGEACVLCNSQKTEVAK